jgi:hypothetical protein
MKSKPSIIWLFGQTPFKICGAVEAVVYRRRGSRQAGGSGSYQFTGRQTQARQEELAVLGVAKRQIARHDLLGDRAQPGDRRARFVEPSHMSIARGEKAEWAGIAWMVLNEQEQPRRRFVILVFEEICHAHPE